MSKNTASPEVNGKNLFTASKFQFNICVKLVSNAEENNPGISSGFANSQAILISFSLELLLKGLLHKCTGTFPTNKNGHQIKKLFSLLPDHTKDKVKVEYNRLINTHVNSSNLKNLDSLLSCLDNSFVQWRYLQEPSKHRKHFNLTEAHFLGDAISKVVDQI